MRELTGQTFYNFDDVRGAFMEYCGESTDIEVFRDSVPALFLHRLHTRWASDDYAMFWCQTVGLEEEFLYALNAPAYIEFTDDELAAYNTFLEFVHDLGWNEVCMYRFY